MTPSNSEVPSVEALVRRAVAGDEEALSTLLARFGPAVEQTLQIGRPWRHALDTSDVMQVTYLEAFLQIDQFNPEQFQSFEAWLRQNAENNLRDAIRGLERQKNMPASRRIETNASEGESHVGLYTLLATTSSTPSRELAHRDVRRLIDAALDKLPEGYAHAVRLYDLQGLSIEEVAAAMGRSPGAVHMLRLRAHERLGALLESAATWFGVRA